MFWQIAGLMCAAFVIAPAARAQRKLLPGQVARLTTINIDGTNARVVYETKDVIEAPNWTPNGKWLVYNSSGLIWRIAADGSGPPQQIETGTARSANNDHVLSPDGRTMYIGSSGHLFAVPIDGGEARKISNDHPPAQKFRYYLHGISPDGKTLAYVGAETLSDGQQQLDLYTIPAAGGSDDRLTHTLAADDGPEYSSDGKWIYFNSELNAKVAGHSQVYRMRPDATGIEQLTHDERVNWFPHISPDGKWIVYLSFPPGTDKHPANKEIVLRRMRPDGTEQNDITRLFGGQGTINVNSWAPDSRRFAFVAYPVLADGAAK
jgi:TolB protein